MWQDISSAPKDGTVVDLFCNGKRFSDYQFHHDSGDWMRIEKMWKGGKDGYQVHSRRFLTDKPTHWQPLPPPPQESGE